MDVHDSRRRCIAGGSSSRVFAHCTCFTTPHMLHSDFLEMLAAPGLASPPVRRRMRNYGFPSPPIVHPRTTSADGSFRSKTTSEERDKVDVPVKVEYIP